FGVLGGDTAGFPNGRRVGDDVTDIAIRAMAGATPLTPSFNNGINAQLGDGVEGNDVPYLAVFPYLGLPQPGNRKAAATQEERDAMRVNRIWMAAAAACVLLSAAPARADWFVTPFVGGNFGGATDQPLFGKTDAITKPAAWGVSGGWTGGGWLG